MHLNVYDVFYSQFSHQHVSADLPTIFSVTLLRVLQAYKGTNVVCCVFNINYNYNNFNCYVVTATHLTTFVPLFSCNNVTLKMAAKAAETCW